MLTVTGDLRKPAAAIVPRLTYLGILYDYGLLRILY